jgi:hypothetical protein
MLVDNFTMRQPQPFWPADVEVRNRSNLVIGVVTREDIRGRRFTVDLPDEVPMAVSSSSLGWHLSHAGYRANDEMQTRVHCSAGRPAPLISVLGGRRGLKRD